jgi:hypothetical protein
MPAPRSTRRLRRSATLLGGVALLVVGGVACGSDDDASTNSSPVEVPGDSAVTTATASSPTVQSSSEPSVPSNDDVASSAPTVPSSDEVATSAAPGPSPTVDDTSDGGDASVPDPAAVAAAVAVLDAIAERNDDVSGSYDLAGGEGCPLIAGFDGEWVAEAGGTLFCGSTDNLTSIGVARSGPFAESIAEGGFEEVGSDGPVRRWCDADACVVSWTDGQIDAFTFSIGSDDPAVAERFLLDHLVEVVDGVGAFDVEQIPAS